MKILISAGELSGDEHAARLVEALKRFNPSVFIRGMGGAASKLAGATLDVRFDESAGVMGFGAPLRAIRQVTAAYRRLAQLIEEWRPDALVIVNYSDFNLKLAGRAKRAGVPVLFYIPPQLWAWRSGRLKTMAKTVDVAAVIFPFERDFYAERGFRNAIYVGHPFTDVMAERVIGPDDQRIFLDRCGYSTKKPLVLFLPGSRKGEVKSHLQPMIEAFKSLHRRHPTVQGALLLAPSIHLDEREVGIPEDLPLRTLREDALTLMQCAHAGLVKSGTSNLQAAYARLPFAMFFKTSKLNEFIVRKFVKLSEYSMVNVLRPGTVRELLQEEADPELAATELERLLFDEAHRQQALDGMREVVDSLSSFDPHPLFEGCRTTSDRVAMLTLQLAKKGRLDLEDRAETRTLLASRA